LFKQDGKMVSLLYWQKEYNKIMMMSSCTLGLRDWATNCLQNANTGGGGGGGIKILTPGKKN